MPEKNTGVWLVPNDLLAKAKEIMLSGNEPVTTTDWVQIVNFWASNLNKELVKAQVPVSEENVQIIVDSQLRYRNWAETGEEFHEKSEQEFLATMNAEDRADYERNQRNQQIEAHYGDSPVCD